MPFLGGGLFTLFAAWYQTATIAISRHWTFRIALFLVLTPAVVLFALPLFPLKLQVHPEEAILYLDGMDTGKPQQSPEGNKSEMLTDAGKPEHLRRWQDGIRVSLAPHLFYLKHFDEDNGTTTQGFKRDWLELVGLVWRGEPLELRMMYPYRFDSLSTEGVTVTIEKTDGPFGADFIREDVLGSNHLKKKGAGTVVLEPQPWQEHETSVESYLPVGSYTAVSSKRGCKPGKTTPFDVRATKVFDKRKTDLPELQCQRN